MRVTNNMMINRSLRDLNVNLSRMDTLQRDISSGKRIHRPSDDPTAMARVFVLKNNMALNEQYTRNIDAATNTLSITDTTLNSVGNAVHRLRALMLTGQNGTLSAENRKAIVQEAEQLRSELISMANTQVNGRYIFGGLKTDIAPYPPAPLTVYDGPNDQGKLSVEIAPRITMEYNVTAFQVFGDTTPPAPATPGTANNLFDVIDEFVGFMNAPTLTTDTTDISIPRLDAFRDSILNLRTEIGGKINRLDMSKTRLSEIGQNLETLLENTEATDVAAASLRLNQTEATFRAALSVGARALPMSLVDFLR